MVHSPKDLRILQLLELGALMKTYFVKEYRMDDAFVAGQICFGIYSASLGFGGDYRDIAKVPIFYFRHFAMTLL